MLPLEKALHLRTETWRRRADRSHSLDVVFREVALCLTSSVGRVQRWLPRANVNGLLSESNLTVSINKRYQRATSSRRRATEVYEAFPAPGTITAPAGIRLNGTLLLMKKCRHRQLGLLR